jgi:hypothetical protein
MENKSLLILPASIDKYRAHYIIPGGYKYLTKKIRLSDFNLLNSQQKPIYFGPKGIYSLIKSIQFINREGIVIDSMTNTDYLILKMMKQSNPVQRDMYRYIYQNMCNSIETISPAQVELTEEQNKQDATKIGGYIDLSFCSDYLMSRNISNDFMTISIEWADLSSVENGYEFSKPPSMYVDEVLTAQPVDAEDVIIYNTVVPDKVAFRAKNIVIANGEYNISSLEETIEETRFNSYNQQIVENMYFYVHNDKENGAISNLGTTYKSMVDTRINLISDGVQLMPYSGLDNDAKRLAHLSDQAGEMCIPAVGAYYNLSTKFGNINNLNDVGVFNPNTNITYSGTHSYTAIGLNKMVIGEIVLQFASKVITPDLNKVFFLQTLAEVKRFYKRSTNQVGNLTMPGK